MLLYASNLQELYSALDMVSISQLLGSHFLSTLCNILCNYYVLTVLKKACGRPPSDNIGSFFSTCQVRVVRFYDSPISSSSSSFSSASSSASSSSAGPQPRPSTPSVPCRTSTASSRPKCSVPDLNHEQTHNHNHNHKHTTTNTQPQTPNHKHNLRIHERSTHMSIQCT